MSAISYTHRARESAPSRVQEWWAALTMFAVGLWLSEAGNVATLSASYRAMTDIAPEPNWAAFMIGLAAVRMLALIVGGVDWRLWRLAPITRTVSACVSGVVWILICFSTRNIEPGSLVAPIAGMIAAGEFALCLYIARSEGAAAHD